MLLYDPQTSGGLLIAAPEEKIDAIAARLRESGYPYPVSVVGEVVAGDPGITVSR